MKIRPPAKIFPMTTLLFSVLLTFPSAQSANSSPVAVSPTMAQKPNRMEIDSMAAAPGQTVNLALSITNERPIGFLDLRMSYDPNFLSFQFATPAVRVAGWPIFGDDGNVLPGEIHVVGVADSGFPMAPGSGEVGYLNFQVINQPVPPGTKLSICFVFRLPEDNRMYDDTGAIIDTNEIEYVCGEIALISTGIADEWKNRPNGFELGQNYPNPFNPSTSFTLTLPKAGRYAVRIYNLAGQVVKIFEGEASAGRQTLTWDGTDKNGNPVSSGIYLYKAEANGFSETKKMILIR